MAKAPVRLLVWGAGTLGARVCTRWRQSAGTVLAYTRTTARHEALRRSGIEPRTGSPTAELSASDALLLALPGHEAQDAAIRILAAVPAPARSFLISSTGAYAGAQGTVDEDGPLGTTPSAHRILEVESQFHAWTRGRGVVIRAGGLYAPGRGPCPPLRIPDRRVPSPPDVQGSPPRPSAPRLAICADGTPSPD